MLDARKLMEMAVEVMDRSVVESRADGKASPRVGALLLKPDGTVETACRGELRDGDHAEYTLLERKNRGNRLDDTVLFSTLEPCAPGSRRHPKLSCSERIVLARIKEVWVGIEDPDPAIDRKGIKYLQDKGVRVHIFDRDLQEVILEKNRDFIEQAEARAAVAREEKGVGPIVLSSLEALLPVADFGDLQLAALQEYRAAIGERGDVESEEFLRRLVLQGLLRKKDRTHAPTGFGWLLFGREPRAHMPHAGLLGTIYYPDGTEETHDFDGPAVEVPGKAIQWLQDKLPNPIMRTQAKRREVNETLLELLREGIVNALIHRDYCIQGAKCQLLVSAGKIQVMSPGLPVEPITMERLQTFDAPMLSRNPVMHFVFAKMKLAEERGLGLKSMRSRASAAGLPLPTFSYRAPYVVLALFKDAVAALPDDLFARLGEAERRGWTWLVTRESVTAAEYQEAIKIPNRTARNHLKSFILLGLLCVVGSGRATRYEVVRF